MIQPDRPAAEAKAVTFVANFQIIAVSLDCRDRPAFHRSAQAAITTETIRRISRFAPFALRR